MTGRHRGSRNPWGRRISAGLVAGGVVSVAAGSAGMLTANGQVYLVNPNGMLIGNGATIDAASFVATTANIGNDAFMASPASVNGRYAFDQVTTASGSGTIVNGGTITAADGGLIAPSRSGGSA